MTKGLVIVESPAKAKTITKYLGKDFTVLASYGHIKDLPEKELGVDVAHGFEPTYEIIPDTKKRNNSKTVRELKSAARKAESIYLAADPDREGEAICQHLREELVGDKAQKPVYRLLFNEITKDAIQASLQSPRQINQALVEAQQARRVLDRLVGYEVSPMLNRGLGGGKVALSAGRVQSVALRLVVEREREILAFQPTEYWTFDARFAAALPPEFTARLFSIHGATLKTGDFDKQRRNERHVRTEAEARDLERQLREVAEWHVAAVTTREKKRHPVAPFITSTLQQEAARKLSFPVKKTMSLAQKLYEGVELGPEGSVGLITYMRTDSTRIADSAITEVRDFITAQYGTNRLPAKPNQYKNKKKGAQDAHEAIRPTSVWRTPEKVAPYLEADELALYRLIWQRFVASQMTPALFDATTIDIEGGPGFVFRATGAVLRFDGFLAVYEEGKDERDTDDEALALKLPRVTEGERVECRELQVNQSFTRPPARYTEATLVKTLEERGIGRPSTYAQTLSVIQSRNYVEKRDGRFHPTPLGMVIADVLTENFADLFDPGYTAVLETQLDEIEEGKLNWREALEEFYRKFRADLEAAKINLKKPRMAWLPTNAATNAGLPWCSGWGALESTCHVPTRSARPPGIMARHRRRPLSRSRLPRWPGKLPVTPAGVRWCANGDAGVSFSPARATRSAKRPAISPRPALPSLPLSSLMKPVQPVASHWPSGRDAMANSSAAQTIRNARISSVKPSCPVRGRAAAATSPNAGPGVAGCSTSAPIQPVMWSIGTSR